MIMYTLPDFTSALGLNLHFARLFVERPTWMQPNVRIASVYGCFPGCTLNGGRSYLRAQTSPVDIERTFAILEEYGLVPRLTFTNMLATPADLDSPYARCILQSAARHGGEVIVYSDKVGREIRRRYGMPLVLSTTRALEDAQAVNNAMQSYDWVVLNYNHHKDSAFLRALDQPKRAEVMVNEFCVRNCPHRQEHYLLNSQEQRACQQHPFECVAKRADFFAHEPGHPITFTTEEVRQLNREYGIEYFKIVGRGVPFATQLEALTYYLVRPEYRKTVKQQVISLLR